VKSELEASEERLNLERLYTADLEQLLKRVLGLRSLDPQLAKFLGELEQQTRELGLARQDKLSLALSLSQKEQRYLALTKVAALSGGSHQRELQAVRTAIERDRHEVRLVERRLEDLRRRLSGLADDVRALDGVLVKPQQVVEELPHSGEVEELRHMNRLLQEEKE
jgi:hypothetical protein